MHAAWCGINNFCALRTVAVHPFSAALHADSGAKPYLGKTLPELEAASRSLPEPFPSAPCCA